MAEQEQFNESEKRERARVQRLEQEQLTWTNILRINTNLNKATKERESFAKELNKFSKDEVQRAEKYVTIQEELSNQQKRLAKARKDKDRDAIRVLEEEIRKNVQLRNETKLRNNSESVLLKQRELAAKKTERSLTAERSLIESINKKIAEGNTLGSVGGRIADLFKSKEEKQRQIDIARIKVQGGENTGKGNTTGGAPGTEKDLGKIGVLLAGVKSLEAPLKAAAQVAKNALVAPFADAAALLTGESVGMGGGKVSAAGATSILGGLEKIVSTLPLVGGLAGGMVSIFKGLVDAVLGVDQANFRVARSLNISTAAASKMRDSFYASSRASGNLAVNETRMLQSQIEIGNQLGINKQLSDDILINDVKLRDILGLEVESRKTITDQAFATGRNAKELTKSLIGTVGAFNNIIGTNFKWNSILAEASKLGGYLGLTLTKYPEKIYKAVMATKALGMDLKQLDATAGGLLDFESSIAKEMEAQVITGKDMNLTLARQAALNNNYVTLSAEITKNIGSAANFLNMNRIAAEALAESMGLTRDSLGDILKKQEIYNRAGVTDQKGLVAKLESLEKQKKLQGEIAQIMGEQGYEMATRLSTAENLSEVMENIKRTFVKFVKDSGLLEFITNPDKMNGFINTLIDKLAGTISIIGNIISAILKGMSHIPGFDYDTFQGLSAQVKSAAGQGAESVRSLNGGFGGVETKPIGETIQKGVRREATPEQKALLKASTSADKGSNTSAGNVYLDSNKVGQILFGETYNQLQV